MATCSVTWRPSGGRGEFEYVPSDTLFGRQINVFIEDLNLTIPSEVFGARRDGKPRLRKLDGNNRKKLHLPGLVMAAARLPRPARELHSATVTFPLRSGSFVMDSMDFDIIDDDGEIATLAPLRVSIRNHSSYQIDLQDRFRAIAADLTKIEEIRDTHPDLADAITRHWEVLATEVNSAEIERAAVEVNSIQDRLFGLTNSASAIELAKAEARPPVEEEEIFGVEGRLLARIHYYKERDKGLPARAKKHYKDKNNGTLVCSACGLDPVGMYGIDGERCLEAHHRIPIEQLQPDSVTRVEDVAVVCASCHRIIHSRKPCIPVEELAVTLKGIREAS